jgi:2-polyprenyl-6-methoxyphenol hydroxylase-like FAD-dependent oxidoreductase
MMLGYLLARAGIDVLVLEKHADFLRDFRGDTLHPSTLELMSELGVLQELLKRPHQEISQVRGRIGTDDIVLGRMSYLRTQCRFMALMPQWEFLDFLSTQAHRYPTFHLRMRTEVTGIIEENGGILGIRGDGPAGPIEVRADLVVGADGRDSKIRGRSGLTVEDVGAPMDALQLQLPRCPDDPDLFLYSDRGKTIVTINRGDYWHCGFVVPKGTAEKMQARGIEDLRTAIVEVAPFLHNRVTELRDWTDVRLLTVRADQLRKWYRPGLVCIGDAAHAMSPVGGIGINLAIQDAVAAANILVGPLRGGAAKTEDLAKIQRRRSFPTRLTQRLQGLIQKQLFSRLGKSESVRSPWPLRLLERTTLPCRIRTRFISVGIRPEHVKTPDVYK